MDLRKVYQKYRKHIDKDAENDAIHASQILHLQEWIDYIASHPDELKGDDGRRGKDGKDGKDGLRGNDGIDGKDGRHGKDGKGRPSW